MKHIYVCLLLSIIYMEISKVDAIASQKDSNSIRATQSFHPSIIGNCELPELKDYNHEMIIYNKKNLKYHLDWNELYSGKAYIGFKNWTNKHIKKTHPKINNFLDEDYFSSGRTTEITGAFISENKHETFYTPEFHSKKEFIETLGRNLTAVNNDERFNLTCNKKVKHSIPFVPEVHIDMNLKISIYSHSEKKWLGDTKNNVDIRELNYMNKHILDQLGDDLEKISSVLVTIQGKDHVLKGGKFITTYFKIPNSNKTLVVTKQFISIESDWLFKKIMAFMPKILKKTILRDFSKFVDTIRSQ